MKKLIPLLLISLILVTGCINGRPPEYSVSNPRAVPDGSGGVVVACQVNNGREMHTFIQRLDAQGKSLWGQRGVDLGPRSGGFAGEHGDFASLIRDSQGNITVVYFQERNIWSTKLDMDGKPVWEEKTTRKISPADIRAPACFRAIGNGAGETIIAWVADNDHISIQKADSDLNYFISISTPNVDIFDIAGDDSGNVFILWKDNPAYSEGNIFVRKLDVSGQDAWQSTGLKLTDAQTPGVVRSRLEHTICGDGEGGAVVAWVQGTLSEDGRHISGLELRAQHVNSVGEPQWGAGGIFLAGNAGEPCLFSDNQDIIVVWSDLRDVWAQKMDITGRALWAENGIRIGQAGEHINTLHYSAATNGEDGTLIVWNYMEDGNKSLYVQNVNAGGNALWNENAVRVSTVAPYWGGYASPARISPDGNGGFFVTWAAGEHIKDKTSSWIQRISRNGEVLWGRDGISLNP